MRCQMSRGYTYWYLREGANRSTHNSRGVAMDVPDQDAYESPGRVDLTDTPGAAISTWSLTWENPASWSWLSMAATDTKELYDAG